MERHDDQQGGEHLDVLAMHRVRPDVEHRSTAPHAVQPIWQVYLSRWSEP
jgi:hypothetical protein